MPGPLRILNVVAAGPSRRYLPAKGGPFPLPAFSVEPCAACASACCSKQVILGASEAIEIGFALGVRLSVFVEPMRWEPKHGGLLSWPFKLDDLGRSVLRFARPDGWCAHLVRPGQSTSRCGIYALRPAICRLYPFVLEDDDERFNVGSQEGCPEQWLQDEATVAAATDSITGLRKHRALDLQIVRAWNRGKRQRSFAGFLEFLEDGAARALGHEPERVARFSA